MYRPVFLRKIDESNPETLAFQRLIFLFSPAWHVNFTTRLVPEVINIKFIEKQFGNFSLHYRKGTE
jgi:hypothetical protein